MVSVLCTMCSVKCLIPKYVDFGGVLPKWSLQPCLPCVEHSARLEQHENVTWLLKLVQGFVSTWMGRMAILDLHETSLVDFDLLEDFNTIFKLLQSGKER